MSADVIWINGLSGAGKTTIGTTLVERFRQSGRSVVLVDGDVVRTIFGADLGYDVEARRTQIRRIQILTKFIADQGVTVVVAALYSAPDLLAWNRANFPGYFEVYLKASLDLVKRRNSKGLYDGTTENVVGIDIDWLVPQSPNLEIDVDEQITPEELVNVIERKLAKLRCTQG